LKENQVKRKLKNGLPSFGSWITIAHPAVAEIMALAGFDWLTIDTEHGAIGIESVQCLIQAMSCTNVVPLVRVAGSDRTIVTRVLDTGAAGLVFPMIKSEEDAINAVRSAKYPPEGVRGVGLARAHGYSEQGREEYLKRANEQMLVIIQIEHVAAVEDIERITAVDGIDALYIGPADLSASMGLLGQYNHPSVLEAIEKVRAVAHRRKVPIGIPVETAEEANARVAEGYQFIQVGMDALYLSSGCRSALKKLEPRAGAGDP
jgi:2-dehydro-3-deoxyglucarate aldolase